MSHPSDPFPSVTIPEAVDALTAGVDIEAVADAAGTTPIGLTVAGVQWCADHRDELTNGQHAWICTVLADAVAPHLPR